MRYREAQLLSPIDLTTAGTKVIDVKVSQPISRIVVRFKTTKALAYMTAPAPANIPKIELVDGSTPLFSVSGYECQALNYYNKPGVNMDHGQHLISQSEVDMYHLDFGRYLWDPLLAFLPTKFVNPQLKITWDEDVADTSVTTNECEVWAHIFDEKAISPIGFLQAIEEKSYTQGASGSYEETSLPEDKIIRQMLIRAFLDGYEPWYNVSEVRFDENGLAKIPFEFTDMEYFARRMKAVWPKISYPFQARAASGGYVLYVPVTQYWAGPQFQQQSGTTVPYVSASASRGGKLTLVAASDIDCDGLVQGWLPWHCYQFSMGLPNDIEDWYDPKGKKPRVRIKSYTGGASSTVQILLEKLHRY